MKKLLTILLTTILPLAHAETNHLANATKIKEWTTGGATMKVRITPVIKKQLDNLENTSIAETSATAQQGNTDKFNTFTTQSRILFYNKSDEPRNISFRIATCVSKPGEHQTPDTFPAQCGYHEEWVTLQSGTYQEVTVNPELTVQFNEPGEYELSTEAVVANIDYTPKNVQRINASDAAAIITVT